MARKSEAADRLGSRLVIAALGLGVLSLIAFGLYREPSPTWIFSLWQRFVAGADGFAPYNRTGNRVEVACPTDAVVIVTLGQSNAANWIRPQSARSESAAAFNFFQGKCYRVEDPVLGAGGADGSLWTQFAQRLSPELDNRPVVVIAAAAPSTTVAAWLGKEGHAKRAEEALASARRSGLIPSLFIWHQGESDAAAQTSGPDYKDRLEKLMERIAATNAAANAKWILFAASACSDLPQGSSAIRSAQAELAAERDDTYLALDTDALGPAFRYDGCHFNGEGRRVIVDSLLALIREKNLFPR